MTNLYNSGKIQISDSILVKLLDGRFEPPVRPHEGEGNGDLGVHSAQGPVLPEEVDWRLVERHPHGGQHHQLQQQPEHERDEAHQQGHRHHRLARHHGPLPQPRPQRSPALAHPGHQHHGTARQQQAQVQTCSTTTLVSVFSTKGVIISNI